MGNPMEMNGLLCKHKLCLGKMLGTSVPSCHVEYGTRASITASVWHLDF